MSLIQDGDPSHTAAATKDYFKHHPWWRPRFTPVHASWLNQAELLNDAFRYPPYLKRCSWHYTLHSRRELVEHIKRLGQSTINFMPIRLSGLGQIRRCDDGLPNIVVMRAQSSTTRIAGSLKKPPMGGN